MLGALPIHVFRHLLQDYRLATLNSVKNGQTDGQTDRRQCDVNSRSYDVH